MQSVLKKKQKPCVILREEESIVGIEIILQILVIIIIIKLHKIVYKHSLRRNYYNHYLRDCKSQDKVEGRGTASVIETDQ